MVEDYTKAFIKDLSNEIEAWINKEFAEKFKQKLEILDRKIHFELKAIDCKLYTYEQYNESTEHKVDERSNFDVSQKGWYGDWWRWITCTLLIGYFFGSADAIQKQMKERVIQECLSQFRELHDNNTVKEIYEAVPSTFENRCQIVNKIITPAILGRESLLGQQETEHKKILEQHELERNYVSLKRQALE